MVPKWGRIDQNIDDSDSLINRDYYLQAQGAKAIQVQNLTRKSYSRKYKLKAFPFWRVGVVMGKAEERSIIRMARGGEGFSNSYGLSRALEVLLREIRGKVG